MGFWLFMLIMDTLLPITMIGFGRMFLNNAPKEINTAFGYRTTMSLKNRDTWEFAHKHCGKLWYTWGKFILPLSIIPMFFVLGESKDTVGTLGGIICFIQLIFFIGSILPTERALKRTFDDNGRRR